MHTRGSSFAEGQLITDAMTSDTNYVRYVPQRRFFSPYYVAYLVRQGGIPVRVENEAKDQFSEAVPNESEAQVWIPSSRVEEADALLAKLRGRSGEEEWVKCTNCGETRPGSHDRC